MALKRSLVLVSDAYGGRGGIALYNRNILRALCSYPLMERVVAIPRVISYALEEMPKNLEYHLNAVGGKLNYIYACLRIILFEPRFDLIICGHLHLLPFAKLLGIFYRCPVVPLIYGIEAWEPTPHWSVNILCRRLNNFISIRKLTARRLIEWAQLSKQSYYYLPNCIDNTKYFIGERSKTLIDRYCIEGKTVIMTTGRLDTQERELNKGFDEVLEALPELRKHIPNIVYLIVGDGEDRGRLADKARRLCVEDIVVFTGYIQDAEKANHYRLADVFAMPGSNPKFDRYPFRFVFLEALACGVPVVGCKLEDHWETQDPDSQLIIQVDPNNKDEIKESILTALLRTKENNQAGIERFYYNTFKSNLHEIIRNIILDIDFDNARNQSRDNIRNTNDETLITENRSYSGFH